MGDWVELGRVELLQIQRRLLATDDYDPSGLLPADQLLLTPDGVLASHDGGWVVDSHHRAHPERGHWNPARVLSVGFTSHYRKMEERFGIAPVGVAGENVVVSVGELVPPSRLAGGLKLRGGQGELVLGDIEVARPCVEFTRFIAGRSEAGAYDLAEERDFLEGGTRGFVMPVTGPGFVVAVGDQVLVRD